MWSVCRPLAQVDLFFMLRYVLSREDAERQWILDRCREVQAAPDDHIDLWSREHYKSSIITLALTIQDLVNDPELTVGIFSYNRPTAKRFLRQIMHEFEHNVFLKWMFEDVLFDKPRKESPKWSEDEGIIIRRKGNPKEATIEAWGLIDAMPTGSHYDVCVYDDVVTDRSVTDGMLPKTTDMWELSVNLSKEGGVRRYVGTRYHDADTYGVIMERRAAVPRLYPGTADGTASGAPVLFSEAWLEDRRVRLSPYNFACQILVNPIPGEEGYFTEDMIRWYEEEPEHGVVYIASDWAVTHGGGDYTVHGVSKVVDNTDLYVVDWWRQQSDPTTGAKAFVDMVSKWRPRDYIAENAQIEKAVGSFLKQMLWERRLGDNFDLFSSSSSKEIKAQAIRGWMGHKRVHFPRNKPWAQALVDELLRFPYGVHDDQVDVMSLFGRKLDKMIAGRPKAEPEPPRGVTMDDLDRRASRRRRGLKNMEAYYVTDGNNGGYATGPT